MKYTKKIQRLFQCFRRQGNASHAQLVRSQRAKRAMRCELLERREVFDGTYHVLADSNFTQDWTNVGLITANNDWSGVPSIIGYRGDDLTTATSADPQTVLSGALTPVNVTANSTTPNTSTSGGIAEFELTDPVVAFQGSGTADAPHLVMHLNTLGRSSIQIAYNLRDVDGSADNATQQVALQYRVGDTGDFINVPSGYVADASTGPSLADLVTPVVATLPSLANDKAQIQVRVLTTNAGGSDEWIGVDDIVVSSVPLELRPDFNIFVDAGSALKKEGNSGSTTFSYTVTRTGDTTGFATVDYVVEGLAFNGMSAAGLNDFSGGFGGTLSFVAGVTSLPVTVTVVGDLNIEQDEGFAVTLQNAFPGNATISTPQVRSGIINDDLRQVLQPGDVVITAMSTAPGADRFAFVPLVDLVEGLQLQFTDNGWDGAAASPVFSSVEGTVVFTVPPGGLAKNTKVIVTVDAGFATVEPTTAGSAIVEGAFAMAGGGDSLIAFVGSPRLESAMTPLFAVNTNVSYLTTGGLINATTYLPSALTIGSTAVEALGTLLNPAVTVQEGQYNHVLTSGSPIGLLQAVANINNWIVDNDNTAGDINSSDFSDGTVPGVLIVESGGNTLVTEGGNTDSYSIVLTSQPTADVNVVIQSDADVATDQPSLLFTSTNWNVPRSVTVTAVDDSDDEGSHTGLITHSVTSSDLNYSGISAASITVTIIDNDAPVPDVRLNEIYVNPLGDEDSREFIEIRAVNNGVTALSGLTLLMFEGDGAAAGTIDLAQDLDPLSTGSNGLLLLGLDYLLSNPWSALVAPGTSIGNLNGAVGSLENGTVTFMIVSGFSGSFGADLDVDNDGALDSTPWVNMVDSVGWSDGGNGDWVYSAASLTQSQGSPDAATRIKSDLSPTTFGSWYNGDLVAGGTGVEYDLGASSSNLPNSAIVTPGAENYASQAPGVSISPISGLSTSEAGGSASFTIVLDVQPVDDVTIPLSVSDPSEGSLSTSTVTFTIFNWNIPQTVTVTGVDDLVDDGDIAYSVVTGVVASFDFAYSGINPSDIGVVNVDDDTIGISVTPVSGLSTTEAGGTTTFTIVLQSLPSADVTIGLSSSDTTEGTVGPNQVVFTSANWNVPQTVTVTGVDDAIVDGDVAYTIITAAAVSLDSVYSGLDASDVSVTNIDNDVAAGPKVSVLTIGDGTDQRSLIRSVTVGFDSAVVIDPDAFSIVRREGGPAILVSSIVSLVDGKTVAELTFAGDNVVNGSLDDGNYRLEIAADKVHANGQELDGDGDGTPGGNYVFGATGADNFFRLYGDYDGNRLVSASDFNEFRASFGKALNLSQFDYDNSGAIGTADFNEFRKRFGRSMTF